MPLQTCLTADDFAGGGDGNLFDDLDAEAFEAGDFARVVGEQADALKVQVAENLRADAALVLDTNGASAGPALAQVTTRQVRSRPGTAPS